MTSSPFELLGERFGSLTKGSARVEKLFEGCRWDETTGAIP